MLAPTSDASNRHVTALPVNPTSHPRLLHGVFMAPSSTI
jgi:hypothetical protein